MRRRIAIGLLLSPDVTASRFMTRRILGDAAPAQPIEFDQMKRCDFTILPGVGAASASLFTACGHLEEKLIPALIHDEECVPAVAVNIASIRTVRPNRRRWRF